MLHDVVALRVAAILEHDVIREAAGTQLPQGACPASQQHELEGWRTLVPVPVHALLLHVRAEEVFFSLLINYTNH